MDKTLLSKVKQVRQEAEARGEAAAGCQPLMSVVRPAPAVHPDQDRPAVRGGEEGRDQDLLQQPAAQNGV